MSLKSLCFIYRFIDDPSKAGFHIIGVHDQLRPWTPQQLAANGLITQKFSSRSSMEAAVQSLSRKFQVAAYCLLSINEYNSLLEESHQLDDFRMKLQSREISLLDSQIDQAQGQQLSEAMQATEKGQIQGFFSRLFGN